MGTGLDRTPVFISESVGSSLVIWGSSFTKDLHPGSEDITGARQTTCVQPLAPGAPTLVS